MSLHAPFLVKQYLSNDVESGSYSRIFWYYPLDKNSSDQGGIGLFFEVISGDVTNEVYEQVVKRFWESFKDNFYISGFEESLKKSTKMFIQLIKNFGVQEGLDVNISLLNVIESPKGYLLKLISFGDSDIFVVREGKFADMSKMVPLNDGLFKPKFLEVELDRKDILMLANKALLRNAFEAEVFNLMGLEALLQSLEVFKEGLSGSTKLFLIAATELEGKQVVSNNKGIKKALGKTGAYAGGLFSRSKELLSKVLEKIKKRQVTSFAEPITTLNGNPPIWSSTQKEEPLEELENLPEDIDITEQEEFENEKPEFSKLDNDLDGAAKESELGSNYIAPPVFHSSEEIEEMTDIDTEEKPTDDEYIIDPVSPIPGKKVSVDDFIISEEVTPSMVLEKSEYKEIINSAIEGVEDNLELIEGGAPKKYVEPPTMPTNGIDYVNELRARHSPLGRMTRHPVIRSILSNISSVWALLLRKALGIVGKEQPGVGKKLFLMRPTNIAKSRKIQPGMVIIFVALVIGLFFWIRASFKQKNIEKTALATYQQQVSLFATFYERSISVIDTEDTERQLELCAPEAEKVFLKEKVVLAEVKTESTIASIKALTGQVQAKVAECQVKFDKIYGIIRVRDAELVTDFKVSLGNDSDISAISLRSSSIVVADKGRKAVYQINVETKGVFKLEDPLGLVIDPLTVGTGEGTLFVCDKVNGVLYYSKNATGNSEGFNRIVGSEPTSIGECSYVDGYAQNAYIVPSTENVVYKVVAKSGGGFEAPLRYIKDLIGVKSIIIDGNIYVVSSVAGKGDITRYMGGKLDNFSIPQSAELGDLTTSYTNPSAERNLYVFDKTKNAVLSIEKPTSKHPGRGIVEKVYQFENNDKFKDVRSIAIDLNPRNQEVNMYVLSGSTIWKVRL